MSVKTWTRGKTLHTWLFSPEPLGLFELALCVSFEADLREDALRVQHQHIYTQSTAKDQIRKIRNQVGSRCHITQWTGAAEEYLSFRCCVTSQTHTLLNHRSACRSIFSSFPSSSTTKPPSCSSSSSSSWLVNFTLKTTEMNRELEALLERLGILSGKINKQT